jgi:hypothetical protein
MEKIKITDENDEYTRLYVTNSNAVSNDGWYIVMDGSTNTRVTTPLTKSELVDWLRNSGLQLDRWAA